MMKSAGSSSSVTLVHLRKELYIQHEHSLGFLYDLINIMEISFELVKNLFQFLLQIYLSWVETSFEFYCIISCYVGQGCMLHVVWPCFTDQ